MNLKDEDEYTKAFNAVTEDAPEGDSGAEASAVTLGAEEAAKSVSTQRLLFVRSRLNKSSHETE